MNEWINKYTGSSSVFQIMDAMPVFDVVTNTIEQNLSYEANSRSADHKISRL